MNCPTRHELETWAQGTQLGDRGDSIESHVETCKPCSELVKQWRRCSTEETLALPRPALSSGISAQQTQPLAGYQDTTLPLPGMLGPYQPIRILGSGGMGEVWLARDTRLDRLVAIKSPKFIGKALLDRFTQEAKLVGKLRHPHICTVFDVFEVDHRPCMVLEYVEGITVNQWVEQAPSPQRIAVLLSKIALAVDFAHSEGIIHRDLKPANVLVTPEDDPRILDFGLAKVLHGDGPDLTETEQLLGTPAYMAPEQARGDHAAVGNATDVYALGGLLFLLLTGRSPFQGENLLQRIQQETPPSPRSLNPIVPQDLDTICSKAMAFEPQSRYPSALAMALDLENWLAGRPIQARRSGLLARGARWTRKRAWPVAAIIVAVMVLGGVISWRLDEARISNLRTRIDQAITEPELLWERRQELESDLTNLAEHSAPIADGLRKRSAEAIHREIRRKLDAPRLSPDDSMRVESQLAWLERYDPGSTRELTRILQMRRSRWEPLPRIAPLIPEPLGDAISDVQTSGKGSWIPWGFLENDPGDLEIEARFDRKSGSDMTVELLLARPDSPSLRFVLQERTDLRQLSIFQGEDRLRSSELPPSQLDHVLIRVAIEEGAYSLEVDRHNPIRFYPLVMTRGDDLRISAKWSDVMEPTEVQLHRADPPQVPSDLQAGDAMYAKGKWGSARQRYTQFLERSLSGDYRAEALFKRGMCQLQLGDFREAATDLEEVALGEGTRFRAPALCHCWYAWRKLGEFERAAGIYDHLASSVSLDAIVETLSEDQIGEILQGVSPQLTGISSLIPSLEQATDLERLVAMQRLVDPEFRAIPFENRFVLLRAYHSLGKLDEVVRLGREISESSRPMPHAIVETSWVLRIMGRGEQALEFVDSHLTPGDAAPVVDDQEIRLERARVLFALERMDEAEQEIDLFFQDQTKSTERYRMFAAACLMKGVVRSQAGDDAAAEQLWNRGRWDSDRWGQLTGTEFVYAITLEGIASAGNEASLKLIAQATLLDSEKSNQQLASILENNAATLIQAIRPALQSELGKASVVDVAFQRMPFREWCCELPILIGSEVMRQSCPSIFEEEDSPVVEQLLLEFVEENRGKQTGALAWSAGAIAASWKGIAPRVALSMVGERSRAPLAYLLAIRYQSREWSEAGRLWQLADSQAVPESVVRQRLVVRGLAKE